MVGDLKVKICGLRDVRTIELARTLGCDYFGMIHHPKSPRYVSLELMRQLRSHIPEGRAVGVVVQPDLKKTQALIDTGIDVLQVHFDLDWQGQLPLLRDILTEKVKLWVVPRIEPGANHPEFLFSEADAMLVDTFSTEHYGGTGKPGDWAGFAQLKSAHPQFQLILAGGLTPENVAEAISQSGADFVDVSSSLESTPGEKSEDKIRALFRELGRLSSGG
jgi:phosphoribosylanthranilate isomerase